MEAEMKRTDCEFLKNVFPNVWPMTSREFHTDPNARADLIASHLKDNVTMQIFEEAIRFNRHLFKGKIILVLNAGIDLCFPLWATKYGAKHVYAVDNSQAVDYIKAIVEPNNMCGKITVLKGRIQDIELPVEKVDIILSNWMGYALLIEDKIQSVIYARDKWLNETGIIFPDCADLLIAGVQNSANKNQRINWWRDVQSFNMKAIRKAASIEPTFQKIDPSEVLTMPVKIWSINLKKLTHKELGFQRSFYIEIMHGGHLEGLLAYFDVRFSKSHVPVQFSTSPWAPYTKWLQTVYYFDEPISVNVGERYHGGLLMKNAMLKDGSYGTKTYLELYSGLRSNLNLIFNRNWLCKWVYVDHTDGTLIGSDKSSASSNSDEKSSSDKNSSKSQDDKRNSLYHSTKSCKTVAAENAVTLKNTKHDWSFHTMKKELLALTANSKLSKKNTEPKSQMLVAAINKHSTKNCQLPAGSQQTNFINTKPKTSSSTPNTFKNGYTHQNDSCLISNDEVNGKNFKHAHRVFTNSERSNESQLANLTFNIANKKEVQRTQSKSYAADGDKSNSTNLISKQNSLLVDNKKANISFSKTHTPKAQNNNTNQNAQRKSVKNHINDCVVANSAEMKTSQKPQASKPKRRYTKKLPFNIKIGLQE